MDPKKDGKAAHFEPCLLKIHPSWISFMKFCEHLKDGEILRLKIQDGLPMVAEESKKKVKFLSKE